MNDQYNLDAEGIRSSYTKMSKSEIYRIIKKARWINKLLQGTMGLEGMGLDKKTLRDFKRKTIKDMINKNENYSRS